MSSDNVISKPSTLLVPGSRPTPSHLDDKNVQDQMNILKTHTEINAFLEQLWQKDPSTYAHCHRVGELSQWLAKEMGMSALERVETYLCGLLHDIGKLHTPDSVLKKPGPLNEEEFGIIKLHPNDSAKITAQIKDISHLATAIRGHHERIDGRGYPDKKQGDDIHIYSRIVLVADTFDAMTNNRVYRKQIDLGRTYEEILRCSGTQFDYAAAQSFVTMHQRQSQVLEQRKQAA